MWLLMLVMRPQDAYGEQCLLNPVPSDSCVLGDGDRCPWPDEFERH